MKGLAEAQLQRANLDVSKSKTLSNSRRLLEYILVSWDGYQLNIFSSWKDRFLVYLDGFEPNLIEILENGPFVPKSPASTPENVLIKPQKQWSPEDIKLVNQDERLKRHEGTSKTRDTKIAALRLKFNVFKALEGEKVQQTYTVLKILLNGLETKDVKISLAEESNSEEDMVTDIH
ncbi:hypothetical protein Tco_1531065 [Tanacetum coccineum]